MARKRVFNVFSLSFLDVMACGLGAAVLLFVIINRTAELRSDEVARQLLGEAQRLEQEGLAGEQQLAPLAQALEETTQELINVQDLSAKAAEELEANRAKLAALDNKAVARQRSVDSLKIDLKAAEAELNKLKANRAARDRQGNAVRTFLGEGDRQYLTGLKMGGKRILILVDASASMLDQTIVNIIRRRNLPDKEKLKARKWRRVIATVDWLTSQVPAASRFQIYTFNVRAAPLIEGSTGKWLQAAGGELLDQCMKNLRRVAPQNGTSLHKAFAAISGFSPRPDNIYLLTDGLPTQGGAQPAGRTVSGEARLRLFRDAVRQLPGGIPVNIILFPLEGDPLAASAYWQLAQVTRGAFLSPAADWP